VARATAVKTVEAEISSGVWDRQKRWELRRDMLIEVARRFSELDEALCTVHSVATDPTRTIGGVPELAVKWQESWKEALGGWSKASDEFTRVIKLAAMISSTQVTSALYGYGELCSRIVEHMVRACDGSAFAANRGERHAAIQSVQSAIREDLGIEIDFPAPQISKIKD
jgi:hypothetical protein